MYNQIKQHPQSVSIVLLTLNGMPQLKQCLDMIFQQDYKGEVEIVHIDSGSNDGTLELVTSFNIKTYHITRAEFHHSRTRNVGVSLAHNEIIVFLSQDAIPANDQWLSCLAAPFQDDMVGAVYGRQIPPEYIGPRRVYAMECIYPRIREVRELAKTNIPKLGLFRFSDANGAILSDLCLRYKFCEKVFICEDHGLCRDILHNGFKVVYEPDAAVIHGHERTLIEEFKWAVDNGISLKRLDILGNSLSGSEFKYGISLFIKELKHFTARGMYLNAFMSFLINIIRWFGVQIGKHENNFPNFIVAQISPGYNREYRLSKPQNN